MMSLKNSIKHIFFSIVKRISWKYYASNNLIDSKMKWGFVNSNQDKLPRVRISNTAILQNKPGIDMADNVFVGHFAVLDGSGGLSIGEGTQIAAHACIISHSSHIAIRLYGDDYTTVGEGDKIGFIRKKTTVGKFVFIGTGAKILPGVTIGNYAVIGAGAIVVSDISEFSIVVGNPARVIGDTRKLDASFLSEYPSLQVSYLKEMAN
ncbi:acyltransferase [Lewinella sp. LCG006]|uniref:acyltransferase n=1 Tax=Lewinella sp. LCG006 TaxID=3231911 RepID=UPI00346137C3